MNSVRESSEYPADVKVQAPPGTGVGAFVGAARPFWRILLRGALLLIVTLGIYRFWLATDVRRFLWANSDVAGDGFEYTGTGLELLIGFCIAVLILVPVYVGLFVAALDLGFIGSISGLLAFALLGLLAQFAIYRARRYRLTRTVFRGLRFHQTGSGWRYALRAVFWWSMVALSLGLAYPWAQASLERYKMRHTFYGELPGYFAGSGLLLFFRGLPMWLAVIGPFFFGLFVTVNMVDWGVVADTIKQGGDDVLARLEGASPGLGSALGIGLLAIIWAVLAAAFLYPAFQAIVLRWWISGIQFGAISVESRLKMGQVYGVYARFLWYALLLAILVALAAAVALFGAGTASGWIGKSQAAEIALTGALVGGYVVVALAYSTVYQATVKLGIWRLCFESLNLSGLELLQRVKARGEASSAVGEGLADALQVGGI